METRVIEFLRANTALISLVIAIIALAQPWLIALWKKFFRNPKIEIYPSGNLEIGYSQYGPTVALHGTLRALHGDVFIKRIRIRVRRVRTNEEHWFAWAAFRSPVLTFNPADAPPMELPAGFIVSQTQPHRYNIVFFDSEIQNEIRPYLERLMQPVITIVQTSNLYFARGSVGYQGIYNRAHDEYAGTQEYRDAFDHLNRSCYWQAGRYELEIYIDTNKGDSKFTKRLAFELAETDIQRLRLNAVTMIENPFRLMAGEQIWNVNFVYPAFEEL